MAIHFAAHGHLILVVIHDNGNLEVLIDPPPARVANR